jgi:hypothetical protein
MEIKAKINKKKGIFPSFYSFVIKQCINPHPAATMDRGEVAFIRQIKNANANVYKIVLFILVKFL